MRNKLTWLHISDIHFYHKTTWHDSVIHDELLDYLQKLFTKNECLRPDFIFCTGDIAFGATTSSTLSDQYKESIIFFDELLRICGRNQYALAKERLFVVPGNHDVNRNKVNKLLQVALSSYADKSFEHSPTMNQYINERSQEFREAVCRLEEYAQFVKDYLPHQYDKEGRHCFAKIVDVEGLTVGIAGFNSAWTCAGPEDDRNIWLPAHWQFNNAWTKIKNAKIRLGLMHHPLDWLNENDRQFAIKRLSTNFHFWLHGHMHDTWVTPVNTYTVIAAGAIGARQCTEFGVNIVHLDLLDSKGTVHLYTHSPNETGWKPATIASHAENGRWPLPSLPFKLDTPPILSPGFRVLADEEHIDDVDTSKIITKEKFSNSIEHYSDTLPKDLQKVIIEDIISNAWELIVFDPFFASKLLSGLAENKKEIAKIILPLCKIATNQALTPHDLKDAFSLLNIDTADTNSVFKQKSIIVFLQFIKHIIYNGGELECIQVIKEKFKEIININEYFVDKFCTDLYFRHKCDYIKIPKLLLETIVESYTRYHLYNEEKPLIRLETIIISPLEVALTKNIESVLDEINVIAEQCKDMTECRWCITAWMRISTLREYLDGEIEFANELQLLIDKFDKKIIKHSSLLQFFYLISFLRSFMRTKCKDFLEKYEHEFSKNRYALLPPQVTLLQLEYASCLYIFCQYNNTETIASLKIAQLAKNNEIIINNLLFKNILISDCIELQKPFPTDNISLKKSIFKWISTYTKNLSRIFAKPLIEKNHLYIKQIKAAVQVYQNKSIYIEAANKSLKAVHENISQYSPSFCAMSCSCFSLIGQKSPLLEAYIERALLADEYSIVRNAHHIARGLYSLRHYNSNVDLTKICELEKKFYKITKIGTSKPKFFWLYYATSQLKDRREEHCFLTDLSLHLSKIRPKCHQLKLKHDEKVTLNFPDTAIDFIKNNATVSLIAAVLSIDLTCAEAWNHLGTAILDSSKDNNIQHLERAANFYTAAKCFAREKQEYDKKYCYNYIRCKSVFYIKSKKIIDHFFINDTVHYLMQPDAHYFFYSKPCIIDFFDVVKRDWPKINIDTRQKIKKLITQVDWIKKSSQSAQEILIQC